MLRLRLRLNNMKTRYICQYNAENCISKLRGWHDIEDQTPNSKTSLERAKGWLSRQSNWSNGLQLRIAEVTEKAVFEFDLK
jgi:hypothetical protein